MKGLILLSMLLITSCSTLETAATWAVKKGLIAKGGQMLQKRAEKEINATTETVSVND